MTPTGHYEYRVMAYGLFNTLSIFQGFQGELTTGSVFWEYLHRFVIYINNMLMYSWNETEHHRHVRLVLERLRKFHLFLKAEKCEFQGIQMDEGKVEALLFLHRLFQFLLPVYPEL